MSDDRERITIRNTWITRLIPLEYFDVMHMKIFPKMNSPRIFWCNEYVSRRRWGKRCKSDKLREIIRPEFFHVSQDEIITRNNSLRVKWWNVILEVPMVMVIWKGWFETVPCRATLATPFSSPLSKNSRNPVYKLRFANVLGRINGDLKRVIWDCSLQSDSEHPIFSPLSKNSRSTVYKLRFASLQDDARGSLSRDGVAIWLREANLEDVFSANELAGIFSSLILGISCRANTKKSSTFLWIASSGRVESCQGKPLK